MPPLSQIRPELPLLPLWHGATGITCRNLIVKLLSPCTLAGPTGLAPVGSDVGEDRLQLLDFNSLAAVMLLTPGARLRLSNLHLTNFAFKTAYTYSPAHPYESLGVGMSIWPTINSAPNTTVCCSMVAVAP